MLQRCSSMPSMGRGHAFDIDDEDSDEGEEEVEDRATVFARLRGGQQPRAPSTPRSSVVSVRGTRGPMLQRHSSMHSMGGGTFRKKKKGRFGRHATPAPPHRPRRTRFRKTQRKGGTRGGGGGLTLHEAIHETAAPRPSHARTGARIVGTVRAAAMFKATLDRQRARKVRPSERRRGSSRTRRRMSERHAPPPPPPRQSFASVVGTMRAASRMKARLDRQRLRRRLEEERAKKQPTVAEMTSAARMAAKERNRRRATATSTKGGSSAGQVWLTARQAREAERGGRARYKSPHEKVPHAKEWTTVHRKKDSLGLFSEM